MSKQKAIEEAIENIEQEIKIKEDMIRTIRSVNWDKPVSEKKWHNICDTPLRKNQLLMLLVKNTFPASENFYLDSDFIIFNLYGFTVWLPTYHENSIGVVMDWNSKDFGPPKMSPRLKLIEQYLGMVERNASWQMQFDWVFPGKADRNIVYKFLYWKLWGPKEKTRQLYKKELEEKLPKHQEREKQYYKKREEIREMQKIFQIQLLPELMKFSKNFFVISYGTIKKSSYEEILKEIAEKS